LALDSKGRRDRHHRALLLLGAVVLARNAIIVIVKAMRIRAYTLEWS
jgi:hypothetical protein